jgi:hypothetical protein
MPKTRRYPPEIREGAQVRTLIRSLSTSVQGRPDLHVGEFFPVSIEVAVTIESAGESGALVSANVVVIRHRSGDS